MNVNLNYLTLTNGLATNNLAGGAINNSGNLTIYASTFAGNVNTYTSAGGGAIRNTANLVVYDSTFEGNQSAYVGGAIANIGSAQIVNCTIVSNLSFTGAGSSGGIFNNGGSLYLTNSIVAGNSPATQDVYSTTAFTQASNIINTANAQVSPLGNYGGPTQTMPPLPGSPAIDGAVNSINALYHYDQRGYVRYSGPAPDIGAVEYEVAQIPFSVMPTAPGPKGTVGLSFANNPGSTYIVFATTNIATPLNSWSNAGPAVETPMYSGKFQFIDAQATNYPQRFFRVQTIGYTNGSVR